MTRIVLTFAAVLFLGVSARAQLLPRAPNPDQSIKGHATPIPSWDIHGHAEDIPNLTVRRLQEANATISPLLPSCLSAVRAGGKYNHLDSVGSHTAAPSKMQLSERDLKAFRRAGGKVQILPSGHRQKEFQAAESACVP